MELSILAVLIAGQTNTYAGYSNTPASGNDRKGHGVLNSGASIVQRALGRHNVACVIVEQPRQSCR